PPRPSPPVASLFPYTTLFRSRGLEVRPTAAVPAVECGIADGVVLLVVRALQILADVHPQRRAGVPEHIPGDSSARRDVVVSGDRSEEHTSELQSLRHLVCRLL